MEIILPTVHRPVTVPSSSSAIGGDGGARAVALDDMAEDALVVLRGVAPLLRNRLSAGVFRLRTSGTVPMRPTCRNS